MNPYKMEGVSSMGPQRSCWGLWVRAAGTTKAGVCGAATGCQASAERSRAAACSFCTVFHEVAVSLREDPGTQAEVQLTWRVGGHRRSLAPSALRCVNSRLAPELSSCLFDSARQSGAPERCLPFADGWTRFRVCVAPAPHLCVKVQSGPAGLLLRPEPPLPTTSASLEGSSLLLLCGARLSPSLHFCTLRHPALCKYLSCGQTGVCVTSISKPGGRGRWRRQGAGKPPAGADHFATRACPASTPGCCSGPGPVATAATVYQAPSPCLMLYRSDLRMWGGGAPFSS